MFATNFAYNRIEAILSSKASKKQKTNQLHALAFECYLQGQKDVKYEIANVLGVKRDDGENL